MEIVPCEASDKSSRYRSIGFEISLGGRLGGKRTRHQLVTDSSPKLSVSGTNRAGLSHGKSGRQKVIGRSSQNAHGGSRRLESCGATIPDGSRLRPAHESTRLRLGTNCQPCPLRGPGSMVKTRAKERWPGRDAFGSKSRSVTLTE